MSRRICLACITALIALGAPAAGLAQTSSQAQYQGVAPETQTPVTRGGGNGGAGGGGSPVGTVAGGGGSTTSSGGSASGGTSGASGNGGALSGVPAAGGAKSNPAIPAPSASSDTTVFSNSDIVILALAALAMIALGVLLRRSTPRPPAGV